MADDTNPPIDTAKPLELPALNKTLSAWQQRLLAVVEVLLCSSLPTQVLIGAVLTAIGIPVHVDGEQLSLTFVLALSLTDSIVLIALMVLLARAHGDSAWLLWRGDRSVTSEIVFGILLVPVAVMIVALLLGSIRLFAPGLHDVPDNPLESLASGGPAGAALFGIVAIVAGGIREELQRAFLLQRFERHLGGAATGVSVLSLAFGLGHRVQGWDAVIATGVLGLFWAIVYIRRRSSIAPIISHAGFNSIEVLRVAMGGS